jgi:hypothetical protein
MKKLFFLGALFAVGLGFTACSSDKDVVGNEIPQGDTNGNNYIAISINLPTDPAIMTRATDNNDAATLLDGTSTEYFVKDITLLVFDGSDNFLEAHDLSASWQSSDDPNVTKKAASGACIAQMVSKKVFAGCKMLVVLNKHSLLEVYGSNQLKVNNTAFTGGFTAFQALLATATTAGSGNNPMVGTINRDASDTEKIIENGIFMTNAPLSNVAGSTANPDPACSTAEYQVLVPITQTYKTASEAQNASNPDKIYVERGVAKVTMESKSGGTLQNAKINGTGDITWDTDGWLLDNTNKTSYLVRSIAGFDDFKVLKSFASGGVFRTLGNTGITDGSPTYKYRIYFSKGTNYDGTSDLFTEAANATFSTDFYSASTTTYLTENPQYCFENTFPVSKQTIKNTTLVQLRTVSKVSGSAVDLYTIGTDKSTVYQKSDIATKLINGAIEYIKANESTYKDGAGDIVADDFTVSEIERDTDIDADSDPATTDADNDGNNFDPKDKGYVTRVKITYTPASGHATFKSDAFASGTTLNSDICTAALNAVKGSGNITKYEGGLSYYHIRIKHFGDILTPWNAGEFNSSTENAPSGATIATIYPDNSGKQDHNYLGRYGVLRNNWYHLSVGTITFLGDAVPHNGAWDDTPDDDLNEYVSFKIHILSWAKRTQNADL